MSQALTVGDLLLVRVWCTTIGGGGQASVNNFHYKVAAVSAVAATDLDVATQIDALIHAEYKGMMTSIAEYRGVQCQIKFPTPPYAAHFVEANVNANAGAGTAGSTPLPSQTCGLVSFQTSRPGQAGRGRMYMPFPDVVNESGGGSPDAIYISQLTVIAGYFDAGLAISQGGRTATLVRVINHGKNKDGVYPIPNSDPIVGASVSATWATQRRRGGFGRQNKSPV